MLKEHLIKILIF